MCNHATYGEKNLETFLFECGCRVCRPSGWSRQPSWPLSLIWREEAPVMTGRSQTCLLTLLWEWRSVFASKPILHSAFICLCLWRTALPSCVLFPVICVVLRTPFPVVSPPVTSSSHWQMSMIQCFPTITRRWWSGTEKNVSGRGSRSDRRRLRREKSTCEPLKLKLRWIQQNWPLQSPSDTWSSHFKCESDFLQEEERQAWRWRSQWVLSFPCSRGRLRWRWGLREGAEETKWVDSASFTSSSSLFFARNGSLNLDK